MEGSVYLKARQEWDERYADLFLGKRKMGRWAAETDPSPSSSRLRWWINAPAHQAI
jgi:hypothetical protein